MENYFYASTIALASLSLFYCVGSILVNSLDKNDSLAGFELPIGYSISVVILSSYFFLNVKLNLITAIWVIIGLLVIIFYCINFRGKIIKSKNWIILLIVISPIILFLFLGIYYGHNFTVFRGNIWDWFNYNTIAVAYSKYTTGELPLLLQAANPMAYIATISLIQRPFAVIVPASWLAIFTVDNFTLLYIYKSLLLSIMMRGLILLIHEISDNLVKSIIVSISIIYSSWIFYVVEVDALSHLSSLALLPFIALYLERTKNLTSYGQHYIFGVLFATMFILYPEFTSICVLALIFLLARSIFFGCERSRLLILRNIFNTILPAIFIIGIHWEASVIFLARQTFGGFTNTADWWGYYGAYLLGPNSPVTDPEVVQQIKNIIRTETNLLNNSTLLDIFIKHSASILPSVFGLFHILSLNFAVLPALLLSIVVLYKYLTWLFSHDEKYTWLRTLSKILLILIIVLIIRGNYWSAVKGISFIMTLVPITMAIILFRSKQKYTRYALYILFILAPFFVVYKYSTYNFGIGRFDGFPSIQNKSSKTDFNWHVDLSKLSECKMVFVDQQNPFLRHFYILNLENTGLAYSTNFPLLESYGTGRIISMPAGHKPEHTCVLR